jgi:hypothetical protein
MFQIHDRLKAISEDRLRKVAQWDEDARLELFRRRLGQLCWRPFHLQQFIKGRELLLRTLRTSTTWAASCAHLQNEINEAKKLL